MFQTSNHTKSGQNECTKSEEDVDNSDHENYVQIILHFLFVIYKKASENKCRIVEYELCNACLRNPLARLSSVVSSNQLSSPSFLPASSYSIQFGPSFDQSNGGRSPTRCCLFPSHPITGLVREARARLRDLA